MENAMFTNRIPVQMRGRWFADGGVWVGLGDGVRYHELRIKSQ